MADPVKVVWFGLTLIVLAFPSRSVDDLYTIQMVDQARQWQQKNRDDLAASLWRKLLIFDPKHPEALIKLGIIEARSGSVGLAEALLHRAMQLNPAPGRLQDLSDAIRVAKGTAPEIALPMPSKAVETPVKTSRAQPPTDKPTKPPTLELQKPAETVATPVRIEPSTSKSTSSRHKEPSKTAEPKLPASKMPSAKQPTASDPTLKATQTRTPVPAAETELNFSTSLDPIQVKPRP